MLEFIGPILLVVFFSLSAIILIKTFRTQPSYIIALVLLLGLILRIVVSGDLFLHDWDERYHALVSKHLMETPLTPRLYGEVLISYDYKDWSRNHVWLSKPILPLWVMAAGMSLFGVNELGVRLLFVILSLFSVFLTFKIGRKLFSQKVGFIAGFLHAIHGLSIEFDGGLVSSDHVDTLIIFLCELAIFCALFYRDYNKRRIFLVGICIGLAFLTKWSMAAILFAIIVGLLLIEQINKVDKAKNIMSIGVVAILTSLPWVLYVLYQFPTEATFIFQQIVAPVVEVIQNHSGGPFYYLVSIGVLFGELIYLPLIWLVFRAVKYRKNNETILMLWITIPLLLLTLIETKRMTYIMICAPAFFLLTAMFVEFLLGAVEIKKYKIIKIITVILLMGLPMRYSLERVKPFKARGYHPEWRTELSRLREDNLNKKIVLYNEPHSINAMFYFDFIAYDKSLTEAEIANIKIQGWTIYEHKGNIYKLK